MKLLEILTYVPEKKEAFEKTITAIHSSLNMNLTANCQGLSCDNCPLFANYSGESCRVDRDKKVMECFDKFEEMENGYEIY